MAKNKRYHGIQMDGQTMNVPFHFRKTAQALNFFAIHNSTSKLNVTKAIKLIWAADRYHLRKFGSLITHDFYLAMTRGPVGSNAKNIAEEDDDYIPADILNYSSQIL